MSSPILVSVIIPVYNHEEYVVEALLSVFNQSYPNIEVIIVDDGSTDRSVEKIELAIKSWVQTPSAPRKITFIQQENQGAHTAINRGLSLANGEWLTILNSDDFFHHNRIEIMLKRVVEGKAEWAFSYVDGVDKESQLLRSKNAWKDSYECGLRNLFFENIPTIGFLLLRYNIVVSSGNLFFSRACYESVGLFKDLKLAHDLDFILRALIFSEPLFVREPLYCYRIHDQNTFHKVQHLKTEEFDRIYREYLCGVFASPPKNLQAPCHWYWPSFFAQWRSRLKMDESLDFYVEREVDHIATSGCSKVISESVSRTNNGHITLISHELSLSGVPKLVLELAISLKANGYVPRVVALSDGPMRLELEKHGIPVYSLNERFRILECLSLLFALIFRVKGKVIVNSAVSWPMALPLFFLRRGKNVFWYIHESLPLQTLLSGRRLSNFISPLMKPVQKFMSGRLWFGSEATGKIWSHAGFPIGKTVYWSGISGSNTFEKPKKAMRLKNLLTVGSVCTRKGTHHLIDAFLLCLKDKRIPEDTLLTIVGFPHRSREEFTSLGDSILKIVTSPYKENVRMVGTVASDQLDPFFLQADIFIQSSTMECLPIALLKAMSLGLPIVTTNVDGCVEAIQDLETGYLCLPYNVNSLADAIVKAVNNPEESIAMGKRAQQQFNQKFSLEKTRGKIFAALTE
ncbi:MAG: glycosyltransferase [Parachlamydiaceae bacterium]